MAEKLKINVSFPQYDRYIYDFIKSQPNPSAFIRKLVESYMNGTLGNSIVHQQGVNIGFNPMQQPILHTENSTNEEVVVTKEEEKNNVDTGEFDLDYQIDAEALNKLDNVLF